MKTTKGFMELTSTECGEVCLEVQKNADTHHSIANLLADAKEYSNAIAHLILATEEHLKALVLFLDSKDFHLRDVEGVKKLFYMHGPRHNLLKEIFSVWLVVKPIVDRQNKMIQSKIKIDQFSLFNRVIDLLDLTTGGLKGFANYHWWKEADKLKQKGFYVDYKDEIFTPSQLNLQDYHTASQHTSVIRQDINKLIDHVKSLGEKELNSFRVLIDESQIKNMITETIKRKS